MFTDSHCHLASHKFADDGPDQIVTRARDAKVTQLITLATSPDDFDANLKLAETFPEVHACLGIHPCDVADAPADALDQLQAKSDHPRLAAIGETGLDYFHPAPPGWDEEDYRKKQRDFLDAHFCLATKMGLNVVIHTRDRSGEASFLDAFDIYQNHAANVRAVFHCFVGSYERARQVIDLGGLVSFGGIATFKNAGDVLDVITRLTTADFMLETDAPYLAPHPHRGKRNEPAYIPQIAACIAAARDEPCDQLAAETTRTAGGFFQLDL